MQQAITDIQHFIWAGEKESIAMICGYLFIDRHLYVSIPTAAEGAYANLVINCSFI